MKNHLHESKGLPPIRNISRNDNQVRKVLYVKGPVVLYELEKHIGREKFAELLHKVYGKKVTTTKEFLEQLEWIATTKAKDFFEKLLIK